jgi:hypothetical protein
MAARAAPVEAAEVVEAEAVEAAPAAEVVRVAQVAEVAALFVPCPYYNTGNACYIFRLLLILT